MTSRIGAKALGDQLYSYIGAIQDLATAVREDLAFEGSDPGPRLTDSQVDSILLSITTLANLASGDLSDLLNEMEVPA